VMEITVEYFFATKMFIGNGTTIPSAANRIEATFPMTYNYSVMVGDYEHNYVHVALLPDLNSKLYPPQFNISYRLRNVKPTL